MWKTTPLSTEDAHITFQTFVPSSLSPNNGEVSKMNGYMDFHSTSSLGHKNGDETKGGR